MSRAVLLLLLAGCPDECREPTFPPRCEGNTLVTCPIPGVDQLFPVAISRDECGAGFCVEVDGGLPDGGVDALCALSPEASPLCAGDDVHSVCEAPESQLICRLGFSTRRSQCLRCLPLDGGATRCEGGLSSTCQGNSECVRPLVCKPVGSGGSCLSP